MERYIINNQNGPAEQARPRLLQFDSMYILPLAPKLISFMQCEKTPLGKRCLKQVERYAYVRTVSVYAQEKCS